MESEHTARAAGLTLLFSRSQPPRLLVSHYESSLMYLLPHTLSFRLRRKLASGNRGNNFGYILDENTLKIWKNVDLWQKLFLLHIEISIVLIANIIYFLTYIHIFSSLSSYSHWPQLGTWFARRLSRKPMTFMGPYGGSLGANWSVHKASGPRFSGSHKSTQLDRLGPVFQQDLCDAETRTEHIAGTYEGLRATAPRRTEEDEEEGRKRGTHTCPCLGTRRGSTESSSSSWSQCGRGVIHVMRRP